MADRLSREKRSWNMSHIHSKDTSIEVTVRRWLFHHGYRYRKNVKSLPGKPDNVLGRYRTVIFVQGCFWHQHPGCIEATIPKTRIEFWENKFSRNIENDKKHKSELEAMGFRVIILWECEIQKHLDDTMAQVVSELGPSFISTGNNPPITP